MQPLGWTGKNTELEPADLQPRPASLYDTVALGRVGSDRAPTLDFFVQPISTGIPMGGEKLRIKTAAETNLWQSGMLDYPNIMHVNGVAVFMTGAISDREKRLLLYGGALTFQVNSGSGDNKRVLIPLTAFRNAFGFPFYPANHLSDYTVVDKCDQVAIHPSTIEPGDQFGCYIKWKPYAKVDKEVLVSVALCGELWSAAPL